MNVFLLKMSLRHILRISTIVRFKDTAAQHNYTRELFNNNYSNLDQLDSMNDVLKNDNDFKRWLS